MSFDHRQDIIEIVRDSSRQPSESFHLLRLTELVLQLLLLLCIFVVRAAHSVERLGHHSHLVGAARRERIARITALEGTNSLDQ